MAAYAITFDNYLELGGVPLNTPAWTHTNLADVLSAPELRGENRVIPGAVGVRPLRHRPNQTTRTVNLVVYGDVRWDGVRRADPVGGLAANLRYLMDNIVNPLVPNTVRSATLHMGTTTLSADVQVLGFEVTANYGPAVVEASMDVNFLKGGFW